MTGRETARAKANRLLLEGRLTVTCVRRGEVTSSCRGEGHIWHQSYRHGSLAWRCTCPARSEQCSHLLALRRVIAVDLTGRGHR